MIPPAPKRNQFFRQFPRALIFWKFFYHGAFMCLSKNLVVGVGPPGIEGAIPGKREAVVGPRGYLFYPPGEEEGGCVNVSFLSEPKPKLATSVASPYIDSSSN